MKTTISLSELIGLQACSEGLARYKRQTNNSSEPVEIASLFGGVNHLSDLVWLADRIVSKESKAQFVCYCALYYLHLLEPHLESQQYDYTKRMLEHPNCIDYYSYMSARDTMSKVSNLASHHSITRDVYYVAKTVLEAVKFIHVYKCDYIYYSLHHVTDAMYFAGEQLAGDEESNKILEQFLKDLFEADKLKEESSNEILLFQPSNAVRNNRS